jgi:Bacterial Ig-like domain (group 1)/Dockerin type I domain/von Willebrand factor type A domain
MSIFQKIKKMQIVILVFALLIGLSSQLLANEPGTAPTGFAPTEPSSTSSLDVFDSEVGLISISIDGMGTLNPSGIIEVEKPVGATVRKAYFGSATRGFRNYQLNPGDVKIDGVSVVWDLSMTSTISSYNYFADVTAMVSSKINSAAPGRIPFDISEINSSQIDGEVLMVVFDDPNVTHEATAVILFGAQDVAGDQFIIGLADPIDLLDPDVIVQMSLGISYGYQGTEQWSIIDVNGSRLTTSAGGHDDGTPNNGALLTVGGLDDNPGNPPDPYGAPTSTTYDDELYDLIPFVDDGDMSITVYTQNPSNDDNIFFGTFFLTGAAIIGEGCLLTPSLDSNDIGTPHTVTATVQDDLANPVVGRQVDFEIVGGPHIGLTGNDITDGSGKAYFTYTGTTVGTDTIQAGFLNSQSQYQYAQNYSYKVWYSLCDTLTPEIICPNDVQVQCFADVPAPDIGLVTVTDPCDPDPVITFVSDISDGGTCPEIITRTYRVTNSYGNFAECVQTITVDDDTPPVIVCPDDISLDCTEPTDPSHTGTATATDNCDPDPVIDYSDVAVNGTITRTWTATDDCDNVAECVQTITIEENDIPVCVLPDDQEFFVCNDTTFNFDVYATDNHQVTCIMSTGDGSFDGSTWTFTTSGDGVYSATFVCTDECDAYCEGTVNITVDVNSAPVCFVPADDDILQCTPQEVCYPVYAEDEDANLDGCEVVSGPGEIINGEWCYTPVSTETAYVTILCTDECGATCEKSFTVEFTLIENWAVLVIDRTGSMYLEDMGGNSRFDRAKTAALADVSKLLDEFDAELPGVFEVAVFSFNSLDGIILEQDFTSNASLLTNAINNIADPAFNTPLAAAMCQGACKFHQLPGCNNHMFTYTDGLENKSYVFEMCPLCDPCDTYVGTGWNYDCDPGNPSSCTDWQMCLFDVFTNNAINTTYYFGEPINPFGKSNPPEDMYFMKAVAELSSGEFSYFSDLETPPYECGDANTDFAVNVSDAVYIINYVFVGGPAPTPLYIADANCDDAVNVSDAAYVINYIFVNGPVPCYECPLIVK